MSVVETVAEIVALIRSARHARGDWVSERGSLIAWTDEFADDRVTIAGRPSLSGPYRLAEWATHPAVFVLDDEERSHYASRPEISLATWALEDGALDAMLAAGVDADYARAAHVAGVTDAWAIIGGWTAGIPVEYLAEVAS